LVTATLRTASEDAFRLADEIVAALVAIGGLLAALGIRNPRRTVEASQCPGGAVVGASRDAARQAFGRLVVPMPRAFERSAGGSETS
jgi:hypothetical protein